MIDPYLAVRDILEAAALLKVAAARMEELSRESGLYPMDRADRIREVAIDLDETARKLMGDVHTARRMEP